MTGRRTLLAVSQVLGMREVALRVHVHHSQVSRWISGQRHPSERSQVALELHCRIPRELWATRQRA
jgi:transcriptional regulator with XRE-family HTH domain